MKTSVRLTGEGLTLQELVEIATCRASVTLDEAALERVDAARACVDRRLATDEAYYGINTGFGYLSDVRIPRQDLGRLQINLIRSHACAVGEPLPKEVVRAVLALRIQTMLRGHSGVRRQTIELMRDMLDRDIVPVVPSRGSVGASGDLAPLAHVALGMIGEGEVLDGDSRQKASVALERAGLVPLVPAPKEGLCLINGTQVMCAVGLLACYDALRLVKGADIACAMTLDAIRGTPTAFRPEIQAVRPHLHQALSARNVLALLEDDAIAESHRNCDRVQDPYSIRCTPQVHGAIRSALAHALDTLLIEASSSTDNPLVFADTDEILSGGNFHGEPLAMVLDFLAIGLAELASISERRLEKLVNPHLSGLPPFLAKDSGLNSGHMITHVVAAALVNENKALCWPASVDSIPTSADKEDHVSMGMTSANKLRQILGNTSRVLAIELIAGADGVEVHAPTTGGRGVRAAWRWVRSLCAPLTEDRSLSEEVERVARSLVRGDLEAAVESDLGIGLE